MRAGVYSRISRDDLGDGLGVERQLEDCAALCERRGWTMVGSYVDNDISAFSGRARPEYERLVSDIQTGMVGAVVAWAPERLHRSPRELEDFIELIEATGTTVETVKAGTWDVSTSHGRLVARMLGIVSRAESERIGERVSRAHQQAQDLGFWRGPIPYGLRASASPGLPETDPDQAPLVEEIFSRVVQGDSLTGIARDFNTAGRRPRRGKAWTHTGIARLIGSPALGGLVDRDGEFKEARFTGVVTPETWRAARSALQRRPRGEARRPREQLTLLGGILTCDEHGHVCYGGSAETTPTYVASQPGHCFVSVARAAADDIVTRVVIERLCRPDALDLFRSTHPATDTQKEVAELVARRDDLAGLVADGLLPAASARPPLAAIQGRLAALESSRFPAPIDVQSLDRPVQAWTNWTMPQRRAVLRVLLDRLTLRHVGHRNGPRVNPDRLHIEWAQPVGA